MNLTNPITPGEVDQWVRAALEADARDVDVLRFHAKVVERLAGPERAGFSTNTGRSTGTGLAIGDDLFPTATPRSATRVSRRRWVVRCGVAAAACLLIAAALGEYLVLTATPASAESLVRSAHSVLSKTADRCYRVEMNLPKGWLTNNSFMRSPEQKLVWTRGDRFRMVMDKDGEQLTWGQDERHRMWVVCDPQNGILFNSNEVPLTLALTLSYLSLDFEQLSREILENFDLQTQEPAPDDANGLVTVVATAKPGTKSLHFQSARLEIEARSKVIRKMELMRMAKGRVLARVTFTYLTEEPQTDASYTLEDNLPPGARILGRDRASERGKLLRKMM